MTAPSPASTCELVSEKCVAPGSGNVACSSAFSAAMSRAASGEASVLRRISTVAMAEILALATTAFSDWPRRSLRGAFIPRCERAGTDFAARMSNKTQATRRTRAIDARAVA